MSIILTVLWIVAMVYTIVLANKNRRSPLIWGLVGLVFSPVLSLVGLLLIGKRYG